MKSPHTCAVIAIYVQARAINIIVNESNEKYNPRGKLSQLRYILIENNAWSRHSIKHTNKNLERKKCGLQTGNYGRCHTSFCQCYTGSVL